MPDATKLVEKLCAVVPKEYGKDLQGVTTYIADMEELKSASPLALVKKWILQNNVSISFKGIYRHPKYDQYTLQDVIDDIVDHYNTIYDTLNIPKKFRRTELDFLRELRVLERETRQLFLEEKKAAITYRESADKTLVNKFINAITGGENPLDIAAVKHFIWQTKRKLWGLQTNWEMMLVLQAYKQGSGKSYAIRHKDSNIGLISPLNDFVFDGPMTAFGDTRERFVFIRNYIAFFDEMEYAERTSIEALKNIITAPTISFRLLGLNKLHEDRQNCTMIGTTNKPLDMIIRDVSGMRRFYSISCKEESIYDRPQDMETINSIDYCEMWASINEKDDESPIHSFLGSEELMKKQEGLRTKNPLEEFLLEKDLSPGDNEVPFPLFIDTFRFWCNQHNLRQCTVPHIVGRSLKSFGYKTQSKTERHDGIVRMKTTIMLNRNTL